MTRSGFARNTYVQRRYPRKKNELRDHNITDVMLCISYNVEIPRYILSNACTDFITLKSEFQGGGGLNLSTVFKTTETVFFV